MFKLLIIFLFFPFLVLCQPRYNLKISAVDTLSANIARRMRYGNEFSDSLSVLKTLKNIAEAYRNDGYLTATFDSVLFDKTNITAYFNVGNKFDRGRIRMEAIPASAMAYAGLKNKKNGIDILEFCKKRELLIRYFENNGYPFVSLVLDSIIVLPNGIDAVAKLIKAHLFVLGSFTTTGYITIDKQYIMSQIGLKIGNIYDESVFKKIPEAINELSFVEVLGHPSIVFKENNTVEIICSLRKKTANRFDGLVGFAPDPKNNYKLLITGKITLELHNMLSKGELVNLDWQKLDALSQKLTAGYTIRYLWNTPFGSESNIILYKQDTSFINTDIYSAIPYYFSYNKLIKFFVEQKSSTLLDQTLIENATILPDYADIKKTNFGAGTKLWNLDYSYNPRKGYIIELQGSSGNKIIDKNPKANPDIYNGIKLKTQNIEINSTISFYIPITQRTVLLIDDKSALMQSSNIFKNELYKIGGAKSLRGFDEGAIPCSRYSILDLEYRFLFQKSSNIFAFYNTAYYENRAEIKTIHDIPYGFGLGLNIQNKSNIFSISYAYGSQFGNPIAFNAAKIHFGYLTVF